MMIERTIRQHELAMERAELVEDHLDDLQDSIDNSDSNSDAMLDIADRTWVHTGSPLSLTLSDVGRDVPEEYSDAFKDLPAKLTRKMHIDLNLPRGHRQWSISDDIKASYALCSACMLDPKTYILTPTGHLLPIHEG
jgi:hypothetical protein